MGEPRLHEKAWVVLTLNGLYFTADALCSAFLAVYFWINNASFETICLYYIVLYGTTAIFFVLAGWYSQARDRLHVYRAGLVLHAVFYGSLLWLQERSAEHPVLLGVLLSVTWGLYWAGYNTFSYDVTTTGKREYYFGLLSSVMGLSGFLAPLISGMIIELTPERNEGFLIVFALACLLYIVSIGVSYYMPHDRTRRPFRFWRAMCPGADQRDWQWVMLTSFAQAGTYYLFYFLLALLMFMETRNELAVGGYAGGQALVGMVTSFLIGGYVGKRTRKHFMLAATIILVAAGLLVTWQMNVYTLIIFGFLRSVSMPAFEIPHAGIRFEVIDKCMSDPSERIEYLSAWEVPLAAGRIVMLASMMGLSWYLGEIGLRLCVLLLCANRFLAYWLLTQTSVVKEATV